MARPKRIPERGDVPAGIVAARLGMIEPRFNASVTDRRRVNE